VFLAILTQLSVPVFSAHNDHRKKPLSTSIIIPCHSLHATYLKNVLEAHAQQTVIPNEIVVSLSGTNNINMSIIEDLRMTDWPFILNIITSPDNLSAGENRNIACSKAKGDIFIHHDADDTPHPKRTEIIKYFFEKHKIVHLIHSWVGDGGSFNELYTNPSAIRFYKPKNTSQIIKNGPRCTFGACAISRKVFNKIQWSHRTKGEDALFCNRIIEKFGRTLMIDAKLILYANSGIDYHKKMLIFNPIHD